jgi:hypothetical protein
VESNGNVDRIHISETTANQLRESGLFEIEERGVIDVKGKGRMKTFWLTGASESNHIVNKFLQAIGSGIYVAQQQYALMSNQSTPVGICKRVLIVCRSSVVRKMIMLKIANSSHVSFSTNDVSVNNILSVVKENRIDIVLFQTAADSRTEDAELETKLLEGGFQGIVILMSSAYHERSISTWTLVFPFEIIELNSIISMITSPYPSHHESRYQRSRTNSISSTSSHSISKKSKVSKSLSSNSLASLLEQ